MKIETTNPPNDLCNVLQGLTDAQKSDIRDMGFQSIMSFTIHNIPPELGYWLLLNYDHQRNELNVGSHIVEITPTKVHDVLGVPMGNIPIYENKRGKKIDIIRKEWRKQSFRYPSTVFVKHVVEKLKSCTQGGTLFKLNFLVVFNSIMGETSKSATAKRNFLSSIKDEADIPNMDWCTYIITCLKRTKEGWNGEEPYNGPLTLLAVLYAHEQQLRRSPEKAITPAIQYVTTGFLVDLEGSMHVDGLRSNDNIKADDHLSQDVEVPVQFDYQLQLPIGPPGATSTDEQTEIVIHQNVNVPQDNEDEDQIQSTDSVLNLKLPIGPSNAHSLSGLSANLVHCDRLEPPGDKKLDVIVIDDDDDAILDPKQEHSVEKFSSSESGMVCVQGYTVKQSSATILEVIFKKHGDIAADCVLKTDSMRSSILETVCEVVKQIQANDVTERLEEIEKRVSDAKAINIDVSWIEAHLETVRKRKEATKMYNLLMKKKANHLLDENVAQINLRNKRAELAAAEERSKEAKRRVEVLQLVAKNLTDNFYESKAKIESWANDPVI